jgi:shikimate kinase
MTADKIYLVGFMGAGKSTMARALGARLGWRVEDVDELIEARERRTVADIFASGGELYFRTVEREVLRGLLTLRHAIVATGGGTFVDPENRAVINADGVSVWLDAPLPDIVARLPPDGRRPLAGDRGAFERLYAVRREAYRQAHVRLDAGRARIEQLVEELLDRLDW